MAIRDGFELFDSVVAMAEAISEIASLTPLVVALRAEAFAGGFPDPLSLQALENGLMVSEKLSVAVEATAAVATAAGVSVLSGRLPAYAAADILTAAAEPVRRRLRANVERLTARRRAD